MTHVDGMIQITWTTAQVHAQAAIMKVTLTEQEARLVLRLIRLSHKGDTNIRGVILTDHINYFQRIKTLPDRIPE